MITVGSTGAALSPDFAEAASRPIVGYDAVLAVDGEPLECDIMRLSVDLGSPSGSDGQSGIPLGASLSSCVSASLAGLSRPVTGEEVEVRIGVETSPGSYEYVTVAWATVTSARTTAAGVTSLEAWGC